VGAAVGGRILADAGAQSQIRSQFSICGLPGRGKLSGLASVGQDATQQQRPQNAQRPVRSAPRTLQVLPYGESKKYDVSGHFAVNTCPEKEAHGSITP